MFVLEKLPLLALGGLLGGFGLATGPTISSDVAFLQPKPVQPFVECSTCNDNGSTPQFIFDCCAPGSDTCRQCSWSVPITCHTYAAQNLCVNRHSKCAIE